MPKEPVNRHAMGVSPARRSSGDLLADRRYEFALAYAERGDFEAAAELLEQTIELAGSWPAAWQALAQARDALGQKAAAVAALKHAAALDAEDELAASLQLARLGAAKPPAAAPERYVESLFDQYAGRFESHLVATLAYRGPAQLADAVARVRAGRFAHVVDLGCGTGLCGEAFRDKADYLEGVDLSPQMIAKARAKALYDALHVQNLLRFLKATQDAGIDLLLAADVLIYIGDLDPLLDAAHRVLRPGGLFAFTLQKAQENEEEKLRNGAARRDEGYVIGVDLRYAHRPTYVQALARRHGYAILLMEEAWSRREAGADVPGLIVVLGRDP